MAPVTAPADPSVKAPKPEGMAGMLAAAFVVVWLPFVYVAFLVATALALLKVGDGAVEELTLHEGHALIATAHLVSAAFGGVIWVMMLKPLLTLRLRKPAVLELRKASHPEIFKLVAEIVRVTGAPMPSDIRVDCGVGARLDLKHGLWSLPAQRTALTFGLPLAAGTSAAEFAGTLANLMGRQQRGLYGRLAFLVRMMNEWLTWVGTNIEPWENAVKKVVVEKKAGSVKLRKMLKAAGQMLSWITQRPIWAIMWVGRIVSRGALRRSVFNGDRCEAAFVGSQATIDSLQRQPHLHAAWEHACATVRQGLVNSRLPDNFPQTVARHAASVQATEESVKTWELGTLFCPSASLRANRVQKLAATGCFTAQGIGAAFLHDFNDLARQATQAHYQHDLGLDIRLFRLVAGDESVNQKRKQEDALAPVRRYFDGLCHPERGLCGESTENAIAPEASSFRQVVKDGRAWIKQRGDVMRAQLREWQVAWQRIRDLEMAHAYALAGLPADSHQYGIEAHRAELYREEIGRQQLILDFSEDPLVVGEARLETRFAAALALLWDTPASQLPAASAQIRAAVPDQAVLYQALAAKLKIVRGLMTFTSAYESLGTKYSGMSADDAQSGAMAFLIPRLMLHTQELLAGLDAVEHVSETPGAQPRSVAAYLIGDCPQESVALLHQDWRGAREDLTAGMAHTAGGLVVPVLDRFIDLYHRTFAFLASAAELTETFLVGDDAAPEPPAEDGVFHSPERVRIPAGVAPSAAAGVLPAAI